ncbi:MFS transporter [Altererythrobacter sp. MF3-039]|uniref:MFS transporter n=1 Tax=Altererythrobacter sp. MF3-039 TaxID=3252901 RepID=UPI00390CC56D
MSGIYRGWTVAGTTVASQMAQAGLLIYGFSALALPLEREFGVSRAEVMIASTFLSLASSGFAPVAGWLVDRGSVKRLMLFGAAMLGFGFALLPAATTIWHVWAIYALILPLANVLLGQITSATLITRWFEKRRGRAMGLSTLGTSLGGFVFPMLFVTLAEIQGWQGAAMICGMATAAMLAVLILLTVRDRPDKEEKTVEFAQTTVDGGETAAAALSTPAILAKPAFWIITIAVGLKIATYFALINNLAGFADGVGIGALVAASMVSLLSLSSMAGKLAFGTLAEKIAAKWLFVGALAMTVASFAILLFVDTTFSLGVACLLLGLSTGGMLPLWGLIVAQHFGEASYGKALGLTNLAMVPVTASASPLAGWSYDQTGGYSAAIWGAMAILTAATFMAALLKDSRTPEAAA